MDEAGVEPGVPLLIGREEELDRMTAFLDRGEPALVLVSGAAGVGKTIFLQAAGAAARARGWSTVPAAADGALEIGPETTREWFSGRMRADLDIPAHDVLAPTAGDFEGGAAQRTAPASPADPLVEQLARRRGRVLLLVDGYLPSAQFGTWFRDVFTGGLIRSHRTQVVVAVADEPASLSSLEPAASARIDLGPLSASAIRRHFYNLRAQPPLRADEIQVFTEEAAARPELLPVLGRLLTLPVAEAPECDPEPSHTG